MKAKEFIEIYKKLSQDIKDKIDEKLEDIQSLERKKFDLSEKIRNLSPQELIELEKDQAKFLIESNEDLEEISTAEFLGKDSEEVEENHTMAIIDHNDDLNEILTTQYPMGVDILDEKIDIIEAEIFRLVPKL